MPATLRSDAESLIPEEVSREIIAKAASQSAALKLFKNVPMGRKVQRLPVLSALATAGFVNPSDTGFKTVSKVSWANKYLTAEAIAVILPLPDDVDADSDEDILKQLEKEGGGAIARALDAAVFFSLGKPVSWPDGVATVAALRGNLVVRGTADKADGGLAEDINQLLGKVEDDGFDPSAFVARRAFRKYVRGARDLNGQKLLEASGTGDMIDGMKVEYLSGIWPGGVGAVEAICGDAEMGIIGVRADITMKLLDQASLYNPDGTLMYALAQQDMKAVRLVARYAFEVANPVSIENLDNANRYPFAVMVGA